MPTDAQLNRASALAHWVGVISVIACGGAAHLFRRWQRSRTLHHETTRPGPITKKTRRIRIWLNRTAHDVARKLHSSRLPWQWLRPAASRRVALLGLYFAFVAALLTAGAINHDHSYLERLGFRSAWVATAQVPLVFLLSMRGGSGPAPLSLLLGAAADRRALNLLHRWVSRSLVVTSTAHAAFFAAEWIQVGFFWTELRIMHKVWWGIAAWAVLLWTAASSARPLRCGAHEFFMAQHVVSAVAFVVLLWKHAHGATRHIVVAAAAVFALDAVLRLANLVWRNARLRLTRGRGRAGACGGCAGLPLLGYRATVQALDEEVTTLTIRGTRFHWTPGQHVQIWLPRLWMHSSHPFTIMAASDPSPNCGCRDVRLVLKSKAGLTRRLNKHASRSLRDVDDPTAGPVVRLLLTGPHGNRRCWYRFDAFVLVSSSTGVAFTLPLLQSVAGDDQSQDLPTRPRTVFALFIVRKATHIETLIEEALPHVQQRFSSASDGARPTLDVNIAVTGTVPDGDGRATDGPDGTREQLSRPSVDDESAQMLIGGDDLEQEEQSRQSHEAASGSALLTHLASLDRQERQDSPLTPLPCRSSQSDISMSSTPQTRRSPRSSLSHISLSDLDLDEEAKMVGAYADRTGTGRSGGAKAGGSPPSYGLQWSYGRPDVCTYIQNAVSSTSGRVAVVVCGGPSLVAAAREAVARLPWEARYEDEEGVSRVTLHIEDG